MSINQSPAIRPKKIARLQEFAVRVTSETGEKIAYTALAGNSIAALESALETYGVCKIAVAPKLRRIK